MGKFYSGRFRPKNIGKYEGDYTKIVYRSMWERQVLKFLDDNPSVLKYSSEEVVIPYRCATDNKLHRYFMDFSILFKNGQRYLIEVKPKAQTKAPRKRAAATTTSKPTRRYITEVMTYAKNQSKWEAANIYAKNRGMIFQIWTEDTLKALGIRLMPEKLAAPRKRVKKVV